MIEINEKVVNDVMRGFHIPAQPDILNRVQRLLEDDEPDLQQMAAIVASDIGISTSILKTINSPFYGMNRTISDINQAVFILGLNAVSSLVTALALRSAFDKKCCISLERFWDEACDVAEAMVYIGSQLKQKVPPEELYSLGLFHNAGIPAMAFRYKNYVDILRIANDDTSRSLLEIEEEHYPCDHTIVGFFWLTLGIYQKVSAS